MATAQCDVCRGDEATVAQYDHLSHLISKHLGKQTRGVVVSCGQCVQLLELWEDFSTQAKTNLDITHPHPGLCVPEVTAEVNDAQAVIIGDTAPQSEVSLPENRSEDVAVHDDNTEQSWTTTSPLLQQQSDLVENRSTCDDYLLVDDRSKCDDYLLEPYTTYPPQQQSDPLAVDVKPLLITTSPPLSFACDQCSIPFMYARSLKLHSSLKHSARKLHMDDHNTTENIGKVTRECKNVFVCPKCNLSLGSKELMISHLLDTCCDTQDDKLVCIYCTCQCNSARGLAMHLRKHLNDTFSVQCKYCDVSFTSMQEVERHEREEHRSSRRTRPGDLAGPFTSVQEGEEHSLAGSNKRMTLRPDVLGVEKHEDIDHISVGGRNKRVSLGPIVLGAEKNKKEGRIGRSKLMSLRPIVLGVQRKSRNPCSHCFRTFARIYDLQRHVRNVHSSKLLLNVAKPKAQVASREGNVVVAKKVSSFQCHLCLQRLKTDKCLDRHLLLHKKYNTDQPQHQAPASTKYTHQCDKCNAWFKTIGALSKHGHFHVRLDHSKQHIKPANVNKTEPANGKLVEPDVKPANGKLVEPDVKPAKRDVKSLTNVMTKKSMNHKCDMCSSIFHTSRNLRKHFVKFHVKNTSNNLNLKYQCKYCKYRFETLRAVMLHTRVHTRGASREPNVRQHKQESPCLDDKKLNFSCHLCALSFDTQRGLSYHVQHHSKQVPASHEDKYEQLSDNQQWECSICHHHFATKTNLKNHFQKSHVKSSSVNCKFKCKKCNARFTTKQALGGHVRYRHSAKLESEISTFPCDFCHEIYQRENDLLVHVQFEHSITNNKVFTNQCDTCGKKFRTKRRLRKHVGMCRNSKQSSHVCVSCNRSFLTVAALGSHQRVHQTSKGAAISNNVKQSVKVTRSSNVCVSCNRTFLTSAALKSHLCLHQASEGATTTTSNHNTKQSIDVTTSSHVCVLCNKTFLTLAALKSHLRGHQASEGATISSNVNTKQSVDATTGSHVCVFCNRSFPTLRSLQNHARVHGGEAAKVEATTPCYVNLNNVQELESKELSSRAQVNTKPPNRLKVEPNLKCDICDKTLSSMSNYKDHMRRMHDEANIPCRVCDLMFKSRVSLVEHVAQSHSTSTPSNDATLQEVNHISVCPYCKSNVRTSQLTQHVNVLHSQYADVEYHKYFKHRDSLYFCNFCLKSESCVNKIVDHIRDDHL